MPPPKPDRVSIFDDDIINALRNTPRATNGELAGRVRCHPRTAQECVKRLELNYKLVCQYGAAPEPGVTSRLVINVADAEAFVASSRFEDGPITRQIADQFGCRPDTAARVWNVLQGIV